MPVKEPKKLTNISGMIPILLTPKDRCPYAIQRGPIDFCDLNDKPCLLESNLECEEWKTIQKEWIEEDKRNAIVST